MEAINDPILVAILCIVFVTSIVANVFFLFNYIANEDYRKYYFNLYMKESEFNVKICKEINDSSNFYELKMKINQTEENKYDL